MESWSALIIFEFPNDAFVTASCLWGDGKVLLGTSNAGVYIFDGDTVEPLRSGFAPVGMHRINDLLI